MRVTLKDKYGHTVQREPGTPDPFATWQGAHGRGAMRTHRARKRLEAETRNALTPTERRRKTRRLAEHKGRIKASAK